VVLIAAIAAAVVALAWRFLTFTGFSNDHYVHVALAQQLLLGERPIRDFLDPGLPLMYLLSAGAQLVGGARLGTEFAVVGTAFAVAAALTVAVAHRLAASLGIALLVTMIEVLSYPRSYSYPKLLAYAVASYAMLAVAERPRRRSVPARPRLVCWRRGGCLRRSREPCRGMADDGSEPGGARGGDRRVRSSVDPVR
jgi:hypothetical protein